MIGPRATRITGRLRCCGVQQRADRIGDGLRDEGAAFWGEMKVIREEPWVAVDLSFQIHQGGRVAAAHSQDGLADGAHADGQALR